MADSTVELEADSPEFAEFHPELLAAMRKAEQKTDADIAEFLDSLMPILADRMRPFMESLGALFLRNHIHEFRMVSDFMYARDRAADAALSRRKENPLN